jgi:hypothetical protein
MVKPAKIRGEGLVAAIVWLDLLIAAKTEHAVEDEADHQQAQAANFQTGAPPGLTRIRPVAAGAAEHDSIPLDAHDLAIVYHRCVGILNVQEASTSHCMDC